MTTGRYVIEFNDGTAALVLEDAKGLHVAIEPGALTIHTPDRQTYIPWHRITGVTYETTRQHADNPPGAVPRASLPGAFRPSGAAPASSDFSGRTGEEAPDDVSRETSSNFRPCGDCHTPITCSESDEDRCP